VGSFNFLRLVAAAMSELPALEDGERGVIVSTASIAGYEGQIGQAAYAASKGAIISLTLPAARELAAFGIRVLSVAPGFFRTPFMDYLPEEVHALLAETVPFPKRYGMPEEFAQLVVHIIVNRALNGETIRIDGAFRLPPWLLDRWTRRSPARQE
jgi:NAD(P)-dependent dehydrogenase (short-subunit alcohol dehydrogenase family)